MTPSSRRPASKPTAGDPPPEAARDDIAAIRAAIRAGAHVKVQPTPGATVTQKTRPLVGEAVRPLQAMKDGQVLVLHHTGAHVVSVRDLTLPTPEESVACRASELRAAGYPSPEAVLTWLVNNGYQADEVELASPGVAQMLDACSRIAAHDAILLLETLLADPALVRRLRRHTRLAVMLPRDRALAVIGQATLDVENAEHAHTDAEEWGDDNEIADADVALEDAYRRQQEAISNLFAAHERPLLAAEAD